MLARWRRAGLIAPALLVIVSLPILIGLGTWQWQRKIWKEALISRLETRRHADPSSYPSVLSEFVRTGDVEYTHMRVTGTFDHSRERHLYDPRPSSQGWDVYTPLIPDGGLPPIFVNRGWVSDAVKDPATRPEGQVAGPVTVTGLVRLETVKPWFAPANDYTGNRWYWRDLVGMQWGPEGAPSPLQLNAEKARPFVPFSLDADATPPNPGGWPKGGTTEINLPNNHLQYVVTWYGFALTLLVVLIVYARQRLAAVE
jgi:surfeit locus 1 family protein